MAGIKALRKVQVGIESVAGTKVAATTLWRGTGLLKDTRNVTMVKEDVGYLGGVNRSYVPKLGGTITLAEVEATFEQLPYILTCGVEALTTGVADGTGTGKIYTYNLATTAQKTPTSLSIETGDNQEAEVMEFCVADSFKISGKAGEAIMMSADFFGRQVALQAFTGALSLPAVEEILFGKAKLYIDAISGTIFTTQKASTLLGFELSVKTGFTPVYTGDGQLYFTFVKQTAPEVKLSVTFEHDGSAAAQKVNWRAGTSVQVGIVATGSALTKGNGSYEAKTMKLGVAGPWTEFSVLDEQDGNDIVTGTLIGKYDVTNSKAPFVAVVVNTLAALP